MCVLPEVLPKAEAQGEIPWLPSSSALQSLASAPTGQLPLGAADLRAWETLPGGVTSRNTEQGRGRARARDKSEGRQAQDQGN